MKLCFQTGLKETEKRFCGVSGEVFVGSRLPSAGKKIYFLFYFFAGTFPSNLCDPCFQLP